MTDLSLLKDRPRATLAIGDVVQNRRARRLGTITAMDDREVTLRWVDRTEDRVRHPHPFPQIDVAHVGRLDIRTTGILLDQVACDLLDAGSAAFLLERLDVSSPVVCDRLADAIEAWAWKTITERRRGSVLHSWRSIIVGTAVRVRQTMENADVAIRLRAIGDMIVRAETPVETPPAAKILAVFDLVKDAVLDVQQIAYAIGVDDGQAADGITRLCLDGHLVRHDLPALVLYGRPGSEPGGHLPNIVIEPPFQFGA